jgi:transcriptional regulator with XRE-family HTH domain
MKNDILVLFGKKVKQYRNARGISQDELSKLSGLSRGYLSKLEKGEKNISLLNIEKIAISLRIGICNFMSLKD